MMHKSGIIVISLVLFLLILIFREKKNISASENVEENDTLALRQVPVYDEIKEVLYEYDSLVTSEIGLTKTVGAALAVVYKGEIALLKCFGVKKAGENDSVDQHTIFRLASVSKPLTGVLAGILEKENIISLDDTLVNYIPGLRLINRNYTQKLTVRNILSHTSGLVPHAYDDLVEINLPMREIIKRLPQANATNAPGNLYAYQNVMFSLYDTLIQKKTGVPFDQMIREKVFIPFNMQNASTGYQAFAENPNKAIPHAGNDGYFHPVQPNKRYYQTLPAAGINASISDLANFITHLLDENQSYTMRELEESVFTPQIQTPLSRSYFSRWDQVDFKSYGIGWRIIHYKGRKIAYHGGYVKGYRAEIALCKEENTGIVYLSNSPSTLAARSVPEYLNRLFAFKDSIHSTFADTKSIY